MADIQIHKAPHSLAVIPFYVTAAFFFLLFSLLLLISSDELGGHHFNPKILAIVHSIVLGWATMIILGAAYQLVPVICETYLYSVRLAFATYILLFGGTLPLIWCFWYFDTGILLMGSGIIIVLSSLLYLINICMTVARSPRDSIYAYYLISSAIWFFLTTLAGLLLAINLNYTFIPRNHLDLLKLHAHAGIVGWFLQLICGVGAKLLPMFLLGKPKDPRLLRIALILQNIGLFLFLVHAYFRDIDFLAIIYGILILIGFLIWCIYIYTCYRNRLRKKIDILMRGSLISILFVPLAVLILVCTFIDSHSKWVSLYGSLLLLGWITGLILHQTFKTLPFIVWNNHYKTMNGKANVPLPKNLYSEQLITVQTYLFYVAIGILCLGLIFSYLLLLKIATVLWVALALLYGYNVATVVFHKPPSS